ncbi:hypothetical protein OHT76_05785 [Streptomyces sp. NBC_00287]|uniref:glycosyltransferase family protein n=1 Tax=Streptomyces sp. NBC_00287 TaxID=2975702 RepID=UPI002E2876BF|nr:hypothetical protein [Streptomyces sp. NBC_00287]
MRIGYSFWGFLGNGITDTPDGGRSHRRPLVDALLARGHDVVFLQANRDLLEAGDDLGYAYEFNMGLPEIDVLFLEWRWAISARNTTCCGSVGHACDLHRQAELLKHYSVRHLTPTVIWDKDRQLPPGSAWRRAKRTAVCEAALAPSADAHQLLFPVDDRLMAQADPKGLARKPRALALGYVGNQYDRDEHFDRFFAPAAASFEHQVGGKWPRTARWPHVSFLGRIPFEQVHHLYGNALATVLLLPQRYAVVGQMTQRIFEAALAGCLPLAPADIRHADRFVPRDLVVESSDQVIERIRHLQRIAGSPEHADLVAACIERLDLFRLSHQVDVLEDILHRVAGAETRRGAV